MCYVYGAFSVFYNCLEKLIRYNCATGAVEDHYSHLELGNVNGHINAKAAKPRGFLPRAL